MFFSQISQNVSKHSEIPPHFQILSSSPHHLDASLNISSHYLDLFQNLWTVSDCEAMQTANETNDENWPSTMTQMAITASNFFYLGDFTVDYKIEYLSDFNISNVPDISLLNLVSWTVYVLSFVLGFLLILFFLFSCQVFCIKKYRLFARCCMIDLNSNSGSASEKCGLFSCILISGLMMGFAIVLMILNNDIFLGFSQSKCFLFNLALEVYTPYPTDTQWLGTFDTISKLSNASEILLKISNDPSLNHSTTYNTSYAMNSYDKILQEFETNLSVYDNRTLYNPNPLTNQENANISSTFLSNWGPSKVSGTSLYYLRLELEMRKIFLNLLETALEDSISLVNQSQNFSDVLVSREDDFEVMGELFGEGFGDLAHTASSFDTNMEKFFNAMVVVLSLNVFPMILGFWGFLMVGFCKWRLCNFCLHCAWILNCVMIFLMVVVLTFGFFYSGLTVWGCEIYTSTFTDTEVFDEISTELNLNSSLSQTMNFCIFNTSHNLAFYYPFGSVLTLSDQLYETVTNLTNTTLSTKYLDADISKITDYYTNYEYMAGKFTGSDEDHPIAVMQTLNLWSNYDSVGSYQTTYGLCEVTADEYVFNEDQCLYDEQYISGEETNVDFGQTICISLNETTQMFATLRYTDSAFNECSTNITTFHSVQNAIIEYYNNLYIYKEQTQALALDMLTSLETYKEKLEYLDNEIETIYNATKSDFKSFDTLLEVTSNPETNGLSKSLNCSFVNEGMLKVGNSICVTTLDGIFYLYITLLLMLLLQIFLALMSCLASIRMLPRDFDSEGQVLIEKNSGGVELRRHSILY